ncbi:hypothetical protein F0562_015524 [Nyssa sinensis]|uniref:Uncharacterized protein n=1 Tax=Nyssa sinensis TaxID=561372 RepID=A0A5J4ZKG2_9ASTE|nr:hypothetical protein F0562_015524 [Nyssa sinensis]
MAGLQYNFFPTDFFFPPQQSVNKDGTRPQVLPVKTRKRDETDDGEVSKTIIQHDNSDKDLKVTLSASPALVPIEKKNQVGECGGQPEKRGCTTGDSEEPRTVVTLVHCDKNLSKVDVSSPLDLY